MTYTIQLRRDDAADWTSVNPILHDGEFGWERDTGKFKIGDGATVWNTLPYTSAVPDDLVEALGDLSDVDLTGAAAGKILGTEDGTTWVPIDPPVVDTDVSYVDRFTATAAQTVFTTSQTPTGELMVWRNGLLQRLTTDYTVSGSTVTLTTGATVGDAITLTYGVVGGTAGPPGPPGSAGTAGPTGPAGKVILAGNIPGVLVAGAGGSRIYNDSGGNLNIANVRASVVTPPSGGPTTFDVNLNGVTIFTTQANRPSIAAAANASSPAVPDVTVWPNGQYITVDTDLIGTTYAGANATIQIGLT